MWSFNWNRNFKIKSTFFSEIAFYQNPFYFDYLFHWMEFGFLGSKWGEKYMSGSSAIYIKKVSLFRQWERKRNFMAIHLGLWGGGENKGGKKRKKDSENKEWWDKGI